MMGAGHDHPEVDEKHKRLKRWQTFSRCRRHPTANFERLSPDSNPQPRAQKSLQGRLRSRRGFQCSTFKPTQRKKRRERAEPDRAAHITSSWVLWKGSPEITTTGRDGCFALRAAGTLARMPSIALLFVLWLLPCPRSFQRETSTHLQRGAAPAQKPPGRRRVGVTALRRRWGGGSKTQ